MAQQAFTETITDYRILSNKARVPQLGVVHEDDASLVNAPFAACFVQLEATESAGVDGMNRGRLRVVAEYTDNTAVELADTSMPFSALGTISASATWTTLRGDDLLRADDAPSATGTYPLNAMDSTMTKRFVLKQDTPLRAVAYYFTDSA